VAVVGGFFAYDFFFIPPYYTLSVGAAQNWVALLVYVIVMVTVARMVSFLSQARGEARRREDETRRLYVVSDRLITEKSVADLLELVAQTIQQTFTARWVAVLLPSGAGCRWPPPPVRSSPPKSVRCSRHRPGDRSRSGQAPGPVAS